MRIVCAWCEHEGRPVEMGVREPLEDSTVTHGLCPAHSVALLQEGPDVLQHLRALQIHVSELEDQLQHRQTAPGAPSLLALRAHLAVVRRDVEAVLDRPPPRSRGEDIALKRAVLAAVRAYTQTVRLTLEGARLCLQRAQYTIARGRRVLDAKRAAHSSAAATSPKSD